LRHQFLSSFCRGHKRVFGRWKPQGALDQRLHGHLNEEIRDASKEKSVRFVIRIGRLAADWALIDDAEARGFVNEFADDADSFNAAFAAAWTKMTSLGYPKGALKTCVVK